MKTGAATVAPFNTSNKMKLTKHSVAGLLGKLRKTTGDEKKAVEQELQRREQLHGRKYPRPYAWTGEKATTTPATTKNKKTIFSSARITITNN